MFCAVSPFALELPLAEIFEGLHVIDIGIIVQIADALAEVMLQGIDEVAQVLLIRLLNLDLIDLIAVDQEANGRLGHGCLPSVSRSAASPPAFLSGRRLRYVRRLMRGDAGGKQPNQRSTATTTRARTSASHTSFAVEISRIATILVDGLSPLNFNDVPRVHRIWLGLKFGNPLLVDVQFNERHLPLSSLGPLPERFD